MSVERGQATHTSPQPPSILQIIADSVNTLIYAPAILVIPFLLDLLYVGGWPVSVLPVFQRFGRRFDDASFTGSERIAEGIRDVGGVDVTGVFSLVLPTLFGGTDASETYDPVSRQDIVIEQPVIAGVLLVGAFFAAALVYGLFGSWLADVGLDRQRSWSARIRALPRLTIRVAATYALGIGIALAVSLPLILAWGATSLAGLDLRGLFLPLIAIAMTALLVLFFFAPEAVFVAGARPAEALRLSVRIVRRNGWLTLGFIGSTTLLSWGLAEIWEQMASNIPGLILAMIGSAFTGCTLALAAMLYFNERWQSLQSDPTATGDKTRSRIRNNDRR
ncbi:MAG: hypothetical protein R2839_09100 [Thermomicrobiales bacterium]